MSDMRLLLFGVGYVGAAVTQAAEAAGIAVAGITRAAFRAARARRGGGAATHLLTTVPPDETGDPVLARYAMPSPRRRSCAGSAISRPPASMATAAAAGSMRTPSLRRVRTAAGGGWQAEEDWRRFADRRAVDLFRLAGIYGPGVRRSTICARERHGASSGRATLSAASIATTSCGR